MTPIFIDTGAFLSRYLQNDQFHAVSLQAWKTLKKQDNPLYTSNFILNETLTLLGRRAGNKFAVQVAESLYNSSLLQILRPDEEEENGALKLMDKFSDHQVGFTDCLSCVLMMKHEIKHVFTFDHHFHLWKFLVIPSQ